MNPMLSYTDSCNCSDSSDIELSDEWGGKKSPKLSRGHRSQYSHTTKLHSPRETLNTTNTFLSVVSTAALNSKCFQVEDI